MDSGYVVCPFRVPSAGKYRLWIRLDLASTGYRYAVDGDKLAELPVKQWRDEDREHRETLDHERRVFDVSYVSHDGSNRHQLAWIKGPELDLSQVPNLTQLRCSQNQLSELDLSNVPELTRLHCEQNDLTELDLSHVPELSRLRCSKNQLNELDVRRCPKLRSLLSSPPSK